VIPPKVDPPGNIPLIFTLEGRTGVWPESVLYDQSGSGGFIDWKEFRDRQDRQIRGPQFRSAGFDPRENLARLVQIEKSKRGPKGDANVFLDLDHLPLGLS
jgi:hypothetical protein